MANPAGTIQVSAPPVYRAGPKNPVAPQTIAIQSATARIAWGSEPGEATVVYDPTSVPVSVGWYVTLSIAGHSFSGVCVSDTPTAASTGLSRTLLFRDNRHWLSKDQVFCSFNQLDDHIVNGVRVKRYAHILPDLSSGVTLEPAQYQLDDGVPMIPTAFPSGPYFGGMIKTYTDAPFTAAQIIEFLLNSEYVRDNWTVSFHPNQYQNPVWDIDALGGKSLAAILQEISDQQGMVFTNTGGPFNLVWVRKGELDGRFPNPLPLLPAAEINPSTGDEQVLVDQVVQGTALSNNPTNVVVLGDRNIYMPLNIPMVQDWVAGWEQFWDLNLLIDDLYSRGVTQSDINTTGGGSWPKGTKFTTIGSSANDPEQVIARQLATAYALEITVSQYQALRTDQQNAFTDFRKFTGRTRMDMPAALYIQQIVFKAFRFPDGFTVTNANGLSIPIDSLEILDKMIARVTYDPVSGAMTADANASTDGNGLAIIQGYQVGQGLFERMNPDRFNLSQWNNAQNVWQAQQFQIDDSGEPGGKFILFNEPIIASSNLVSIINGYGVFNAKPTKSDGVTPGFDVPQVQCCVCFAAEKYFYFTTGEIDAGATETYPVSGLNKEIIYTYGVPGSTEVPYSDGLFADQKAFLFTYPLTLNQYIYAKGGYVHPLNPNAQGNYPTAIQINPIFDSITVQLTPQTASEQVSYTTEFARTHYTPERDLDRNTKLKTLLPGQQQLRAEAVTAKLIASALQVSPEFRHSLSEAFRGFFGSDEPLYQTNVIANPTADTSYPVGTPLWSLPGTGTATSRSNTVAAAPAQTTSQHSTFVGVTTRHQETSGSGQPIYVQRSGTIYCQVMGPVQALQPVGQVAGQPYLSASASINFVGTAQESITTPTIQLIRVQVGSTVPTEGSSPFQIEKFSETQVYINPQSALLDGLDITNQVQIYGLDQPFTVQNGTLIYLEVLFDVNGNALFANIAIANSVTPGAPNPTGGVVTGRLGWRSQTADGFTSPTQFPDLVGLVDNQNLTAEELLQYQESSYWVAYTGSIAPTSPEQISAAAIKLFTAANAPARFNQFYAYALIGFCTTSPGATGITLNGAGTNTAFTVVQAINTHLMLEGFCYAGNPANVPTPYSAPFVLTLPIPTILGTPSDNTEIVTITMPTGFSSATILFSVDGKVFQKYTSPITINSAGSHTVEAYATQPGYYDSNTSTGQFAI